jgi:peptide/nickel transport system substrate-binding protein
MVQGSNHGAIVPWEILEAVKSLVSEGSASHTAYAYNASAELTEVDLLGQKCVADIKAKLQELATARRVPAALKGFLTPAQAARDYRLAIDFITRHGHAYISNGGFLLDRYDPANNTGVLLANRDPSYPYARGYFIAALAGSYARIEAVTVPAYHRGTDLTVGVTVSRIAFPAATATPAVKAQVRVTLMAGREKVYTAGPVKPGSFAASIPAADLAALAPGSYPVVVEAGLGAETGAVETATLLVF